jgi:hypothetical protein
MKAIISILLSFGVSFIIDHYYPNSLVPLVTGGLLVFVIYFINDEKINLK